MKVRPLSPRLGAVVNFIKGGNMAKVVHEIEKCIGCGTCAALCPDFWEMQEGKSHLKGSTQEGENFVLEKEFTPEELECNKNAAQSCPVNCIKVEE
jgi:ferredoxin